MRSWVLTLAALFAAAVLTPAVSPAEAHRWHRASGDAQIVRYHRDYSRHRVPYYAADPYAYRYRPVGYYPYYNSRYWVPTPVLRYRQACCRPYAALPSYYRAWGYPYDVYPNSYVVRRGVYWHHRR
jgi:hypothetical protein